MPRGSRRIPAFGRHRARQPGAPARTVAQAAPETLTVVRYRAQPAALTIARARLARQRRAGAPADRVAAAFPPLAARGRGVAPAAVRAVTGWVFAAFAGTSLRQIMLVHDVANLGSCRVAEKAGFPFRELSPASPPHWPSDAHIHVLAR